MNVSAHFYRLLDGVFVGRAYSGPADHLVENTPEGCAPYFGPVDWRTKRVSDTTADPVALVDYEPPVDMVELARAARAMRDSRLAATDWLVVRAMDGGPPLTDAMRQYRAALRDITEQPAFPASITWPEPPTG